MKNKYLTATALILLLLAGAIIFFMLKNPAKVTQITPTTITEAGGNEE